jgi:hypothetical protein
MVLLVTVLEREWDAECDVLMVVLGDVLAGVLCDA